MRRHRPFIPFLLAPALLAGALAAQPIGRLAAIGDSLSDEYFEASYSYARNWTILLVEERAIDMGPLPAGGWGEPRRDGYEDDWARSGATAADAIAQGQHFGVEDGVATRGVSHAVVFLGANDFSPTTGAAFWNPVYGGTWSELDVATYVDARVAELETILDTIAPTGVKIVLCGAPDTTSTPLVRLIYSNAGGRERVAQAVSAFGDAVRAVAEERALVFVDSWGFGRVVYGAPAAPRATLAIGNVAIDLATIDLTGANPDRAWVSDGFHPNTIVQGLTANLILLALDRYGAGVAPFAESELDANAGLVYGGSDTLEAQLGAPLASFVHDFHTLFVDGFETGLAPWSATVP